MEGTVLLILSLVFVVFVAVGFLFGLRGLKKQGVRFACFFVAIILALLFAPLLAKTIMGIKITYQGELTSLNDILLTILNGIDDVKRFTEASPTIKTLIQNIPLMVGNVLSFTIMAYILSFLSWIVYLIFASLINRKYKDIKARGEKPKRYRLFGGLVGAVQGLILCFVTFLPISGLVNIVTDLQQQPVIAATEQTEMSPTAKLIDENLSQDIKDIISGYSKSPICWTGNIFNMNNNIFNAIAATQVDGINIYLRDEILNIANAYDNVNFLLDLEINLDNLKVIDYNKVLKAIDYIFNSNILKAALPDFTQIVFNEVLNSENVKDDAELSELLSTIKVELEAEDGVVDNLKNELVCIVNTVKLVAQSPIIDQIPQENEELDNERLTNIIKALEADKKYLFNNIIDVSFDSRILNKVIVFGINKGLNKVEDDLIKNLEDNTVQIGRIDITKKDLVLKKAEAKSMLSSLINIMDELLKVDFDAVKDDFRTLFEYNLPYVIENAGTMMNAIQNMTVFNQTNNIYDNLITQLARTDYNNYIDFDVLKVDNVWLIETKNLATSVTKLVDSKAISYFEKDGDVYKIETENITKMLEGLTQITEVNGESKTLIRQILEPIYGGRAFSKLINICFENLNEVISDIGELIKEGTKLGDLNLENIFTESEKEKVLAFVDNIAMYVKALDLKEVEEDPFVSILESNLAQLGTCLDLIKAQNMFADKVEDGITQKGVFTNLVDALVETEYNDYVNFACFTDPDLKFNEELNNIQPTIQKMLSKQIVLEDNTTKSLIEYIIDQGDWELLLKQVSKDDISEIFTPLMNSRIFEPIGVMVVNKINEQIQDVVGEYGSLITTIVGDLDKEEVAQVIEVLGDVTEIIEDVTAEDFNISDFATGEKSEKLGELLTNLQDNANDDGVFANAYDAMIDYVKADEDIGSSVVELMEEYPEGQIDWTQLLKDLKIKQQG